MAQQSEAGIPRAGKRKWGYDPAQVDAFLERAHALYDSDGAQLTQRDIQNVSFDLTRGGYEVAQVDAALARLERAVVDKQTTWEISQHGRIAWKAKTEELYREIVKHLDRAEGERFGSGKPRTPSYDRKQVDRLSDQIADKAASELGLDGVSKKDVGDLDKITADFVSNSVFTQRKGKKGYDERQVDYFLNTCAQLLSRLESFARIADYITTGDDDASASVSAQSASSDAAPVDGVAPLFSPDAQYQRPAAPQADVSDAPQSYAPPAVAPAPPVAAAPAVSAPVAPARDAAARAESFDALSQAEQSLFTPSPEPPVASPSVVLAGNAAAASVASTPVAPVASTPAVAPAVTPVVTPAPAAAPAQTMPVQPVAAAQATVPVQTAPVQTMPVQTAPVEPAAPVAQPVSFTPSAQPVHAAQPVTPAPVMTPAPVQTVPVQAAPSFAPAQTATAPTAAPVEAPAQPVQPAPSTYPTQPISVAAAAQPVAQPAPVASAPATHETTAPAPAAAAETEPTTGSLAALAHMAAVSQEFPAIDAPSFTPQMPRLDIPSVTSSQAPVAAPAPAPTRASHAAHAAHAAPAQTNPAPAPAVQANPFSLLSTDDGNLEIPNLSFPGLGNDEKKQQ